MNKQTVALIALFAGWILTAETADATIYKDIAGGDVTDYVFSAEYIDREISRRQTRECVQDHEIHLHPRRHTY
jgi:hypothetical protein